MVDISFKCPDCDQQLEASEDILGETINCPSCGTAIVLSTPILPVDDKILCPYCGETISALTNKCRHCGEVLDEPRKSNEEQGHRTSYTPVPQMRAPLRGFGKRRPVLRYALLLLGMAGVALVLHEVQYLKKESSLIDPARQVKLSTRVVKDYLDARSWKDRVAMIWNAEQLGEQVQNKFKTKDGPIHYERIEVVGDDPAAMDGYTRVRVVYDLQNGLLGPTENDAIFYVLCMEGKCLIDWEASMGVNPMTMLEFRSRKPSEPVTLRVCARLSPAPWSNRITEKYWRLSISGPNGEGDTIDAYVRKDTAAGAWLFSVLKKDATFQMTLAMSYSDAIEEYAVDGVEEMMWKSPYLTKRKDDELRREFAKERQRPASSDASGRTIQPGNGMANADATFKYWVCENEFVSLIARANRSRAGIINTQQRGAGIQAIWLHRMEKAPSGVDVELVACCNQINEQLDVISDKIIAANSSSESLEEMGDALLELARRWRNMMRFQYVLKIRYGTEFPLPDSLSGRPIPFLIT